MLRPNKGKNSISFGIALINSYNIFVTESSKNVIAELSSYRFKEDADGRPLETPIKDNDHSLDALRYAVSYKTKRGESNLLAFG